MRQHPADELPRHLRLIRRMVIVRRDHRIDRRARLRRILHIAQMDRIERRLAHAQNQPPPLLQADVRRALDQVRRKPVRDARERSHGAGKHDHRVHRIASAGDARADVLRRKLLHLAQRAAVLRPQQFLRKVIAPAQLQFLGEDAQGILGRHQVNPPHAGIRSHRPQHLTSIDRTTGSCNGKRQCAARGLH